MNGYDREKAREYIASHVDRGIARPFGAGLPAILDAFISHDLGFMRLSQVLDEEGNSGENEYDDDEAFEYILDAYLSDHPAGEERAMELAALLDQYMHWQYRFLEVSGLTDPQG